MDKSDINFYKVIAEAYTANDHEFEEGIPEPDNLLKKLKSVVSKELYEEMYDSLMVFLNDYQSYSVAMGMKLAVSIMNDKYVPTL